VADHDKFLKENKYLLKNDKTLTEIVELIIKLWDITTEKDKKMLLLLRKKTRIIKRRRLE